jgi:hypothetical protein
VEFQASSPSSGIIRPVNTLFISSLEPIKAGFSLLERNLQGTTLIVQQERGPGDLDPKTPVLFETFKNVV